jgi:hypothetical protein
MIYSIILTILTFLQPTTPTYQFAREVSEKYNVPRTDYVILINYSKPIDEERLFIFDMNKKEIIIASKVSHAYNSGKKIPTKFSNVIGSKKSSTGGFMTLGSYNGSWGYSMKLRGLDFNLNDNSEVRGIIFHPNITNNVTYSDGCFMTPKNINKKIIDLTKNGCLVYVY